MFIFFFFFFFFLIVNFLFCVFFFEFNILVKLAENENPIDYIPIRLWTTWSKTKSIIYMTIADTTRVQSNLILKQKLCSTLTTKWDDQSSRKQFFYKQLNYFINFS